LFTVACFLPGRAKDLSAPPYSSFQRVEQVKDLGTTLTNQNSIQEEIKCRIESGNACYHSAQTFLSSSLLSKNIKIKIYRTIILPDVFYECETRSLTLREVCRLRVFEWIFHRTGAEAFVIVYYFVPS
jgi:hypothetical protein